MEGSKQVVVITGGSGFLAQHLIRELQLHCSNSVQEIRVVDKRLFSKFLHYPDSIRVTEWIADCVEESELEPALIGASTVFHLAARPYAFGVYQDREKQWEDSVIATKVLVNLMIKLGMENLVFVGDAYSYLGLLEDAQGPVEIGTLNPPRSGHWLLGAHGEAKFLAEEIVRNSNGKVGAVGVTLRTVVVRPPVLYGEGDNWVVPGTLRLAREWGGMVPRVGKDWHPFQMTYAGNCAAMLLDVWRRLAEQPEVFGGEVFFCTEGRDWQTLYDYLTPFLEMAGCRVSSTAIHYETAVLATWLVESFLRLLPLRLSLAVPNSTMVRIIGRLNFHFSPTKARLLLHWKPPYSPPEAMKTTLSWWKKNINRAFL